MQVDIKAQEDEIFRFVKTDNSEQIEEKPVQPEPPKRREPTLNNPSGHEWFDGTSWGLK